MTTERCASCTCGSLTAIVRGEPTRISVCHCLACQQRTGSVFGAQARFRLEDAQLSGPSTSFVRIGDSGGRATFHFCPTCGSTVYYFVDGMPGVVAIPTGAFADPDFPPPRFSVYEERMHDWVELKGDMQHED